MFKQPFSMKRKIVKNSKMQAITFTEFSFLGKMLIIVLKTKQKLICQNRFANKEKVFEIQNENHKKLDIFPTY